MDINRLLLKIKNTKRAHLILLRKYAKEYIQKVWDELCEEQLSSCTSLNDMEHGLEFLDAIWKASTEILPSLEVQVVIDDNWKLHISSGSAGFVGFPSEPKGLKLPIRCWIHTHPFGAAYFSHVDWRTVSIWGQHMKCAYVLGGGLHYGFWEQKNPNELTIYYDDTDKCRVQVKSEGLALPEPTGVE